MLKATLETNVDSTKNPIAFLPISLRQGYFEGEWLEAILKEINTKFAECIIVIGNGDIAKYNVMSEGFVDKQDDKKARQIADEWGDEWLGKAQEKINTLLNIPHRTLVWQQLAPSLEENEKCLTFYEKKKKESEGKIDNLIHEGSMNFTSNHNKKKKKQIVEHTPQFSVTAAEKQNFSKQYITTELTKFACLREWPTKQEFFKSTSSQKVRQIHFCYPFGKTEVAQKVREALQIILNEESNIVINTITFTGNPRPNKEVLNNQHITNPPKENSKSSTNISLYPSITGQLEKTASDPFVDDDVAMFESEGSPPPEPVADENLATVFLAKVTDKLFQHTNQELTDKQTRNIARLSYFLQMQSKQKPSAIPNNSFTFDATSDSLKIANSGYQLPSQTP